MIKINYFFSDLLQIIGWVDWMEETNGSEDFEDTQGIIQSLQRCRSSGDWADFVFVIGPDEEEFKVHKLVIGARSPVFTKMMSNGMKESNEGHVRRSSELH